MNQPRTILHVDMDAFFAAVEQRDHPELRGKPVLIGHDGPRGVVATASYEARKFGCHSAQPIVIAKRRCPEAIIVPPNGKAYRQASKQVFEIFERFTPLVQPLSIDEAFLDVTGSLRLHGSAETIAQEIRRLITDETQLTGSVGIAPNKFLAKIASDLDKPDGLTIIQPDQVEAFLHELPIGKIPGVGPATERKFHHLGITTIGQTRSLDLDVLQQQFGSSAQRYWELSRGIDERQVVSDGEAKSISHEQTFGVDVAEPDEIRRVMLGQTEQVAWRLRKYDLHARTLTLKIRYGDFETITRSTTLQSPSNHTDDLWTSAKGLFDTWIAKEGFKPVRLIGVTATQFDQTPQMGLFEDENRDKQSAVEQATDTIVEKFGKHAIRRAGAIPRDNEPRP
ncbi:MAG: DNA polymerase IV [Planctomycetota bacterium]|nr:DNA polymerase IV [Planctomycetota bacterium]